MAHLTRNAAGAIAAALAFISPALAEDGPPPPVLPLVTAQTGPLLVSADMRSGTDLSGPWHYSIDPYRSGLAGFHGEMPDLGQQRWLDVDVRKLDDTRLVSAALLVERDKSAAVPTMTMADPLANDLDIVAINTYNGWYTTDRLSDLPGSVWRVPADRPLVFSEFGADAKAGFHGGANPQKFSEEFQAEFYRKTLEMADRLPTLRGLSPWILKDFRSPRRQNPDFQMGWNRKGLISETGEHKMAFDVLANYYAGKVGNAGK